MKGREGKRESEKGKGKSILWIIVQCMTFVESEAMVK